MFGLLILLCATSAAHAATCSGKFSAADRTQILDAHNNLRSTIAKGSFVAKTNKMPAATNMVKLIYDCDLENQAQTWADRCVFEHSTSAQRPGQGENLYMAWSSAKVTVTGKGLAASNSWAKEFQDYGWGDVKFSMDVANTGVGHATQMTWANTTRVGCGAGLCDSGNSVLVVCRYGPQGNIIDRNVYEPGTAGSKCPIGTKANADLLCA